MAAAAILDIIIMLLWALMTIVWRSLSTYQILRHLQFYQK